MSALEAQIDFSDVEDAESYTVSDVRRLTSEAIERIRTMLASAQAGQRLREGINVVIAGPPNVGKSTLMNVISKREVSIVSRHPGTTRDLIEVSLDLGGYPLTLVDTAGIRSAEDEVEIGGHRESTASSTGCGFDFVALRVRNHRRLFHLASSQP